MNRPSWRALGIAAVLIATRSAPSASAPATLEPSALHPGQRAVVRTVFSGTAVDSFEAEIVGTLQAGRTEGNLVVARATSERVVRSGIALGMSGSPVFVDGYLVGALSSTWSFQREPLFGITPIGEMLEIWKRKEASSEPAESEGPSGVESLGPSTPLRFRELSWSGDEDTAPAVDEPAPTDVDASRPVALALPVACAGLAPAATDLAREWLTPLGLSVIPAAVPASNGRGAPPPPLEPGSPVSIELLRGDLQIAAIGTLTWREGDHVLIFGHPLFQSGDIRMPLAGAEVVTVVSSQLISFKLGRPTGEVGAVLQDRRAGVSGRLGAKARMLPVAVEVTGAAPKPQTFHFESVEDRALAPALIGLAASNSLLESGGTGAAQTIRWTLRLHRPNGSPLELDDVAASETPTADLGTALMGPLRFVFGNPFSRPDVDSVTVRLDVATGRRAFALRSARVIEPSVSPGESLHVACEIERWRGPRETRRIALAVPEEVPDGRYTVWVGGGGELSRYEAGRLPDRYRATSLEDGWRRLSTTRSTDALYAALFARAVEVTTEGRDYPELPASALALMGAEPASGTGRRADLAELDERRVPLGGGLRGELQLDVVVESERPLGQP